MLCLDCHAPHNDDTPCPPRDEHPRYTADGVPIWTARRPDWCYTCDRPIRTGEPMTHANHGGVAHPECRDTG